MAEGTDDARTSYPYISANQWWGLRNRFKRAVPSGPVTLDWIMGALDTTQKGAGNVLPQLRLLGLTDANNKATDLVHDFKDDETYAAATKAILAEAYPPQRSWRHTTTPTPTRRGSQAGLAGTRKQASVPPSIKRSSIS